MTSQITAVLFEGGNAPASETISCKVSLSTMWAIRNFSSLEDFFVMAHRLGFTSLELNHQVNSAMLAGIELARYPFSSVHEPCPADISSEVLKARDWLISATDEGSWRQGVASIQRSIDLAKELGASVVVVHAGNILAKSSLEDELRVYFEGGQTRSQEYEDVKNRLVELRAQLAGPRLEAAKKGMVELIAYASRLGICLGLENRYHYLDIPGLDEMEALLSLAGPEQLGFVYDVGHAQVLDRLGLYPHEQWRRRYASRMVGVHLHDVIGVTDHCAPGLGEVDFDQVAACLPEDAFRTLELRVSNTPEQVKAGLKFLVEKGCIQCR